MADALEPLLVEMIREAERAVDHQIKDAEESDDKNEHLLGLGVVLIGAEVAGVAYLPGIAASDAASAAFGAAVLFALFGLVAFLDAYVGIWRRSRLRTGLHPAWLATKANDPAWTPTEHLVAAAAAYDEVYATNLGTLERTFRARRVGLAFLFASATFAAGGALYGLA